MSASPFLARGNRREKARAAFPPALAGEAVRPAANKYGARKTVCGAGHQHDSKVEARRCGELHLLQRAGEIAELVVQPQYWFVINGTAVIHENGRRCGYRADFSYTERGKFIVEDVKGAYRDAAWVLRKAIFRACFPDIILKEVS